MIDRSSPFWRLPTGLDPKPVLFLDGIRHAAQIADLAYGRLRDELTQLASTQSAPDASRDYTAPFLLAWAFVDAVDRLRCLLLRFPGGGAPAATAGSSFYEGTQSIRSLRNISDHLAQRADYVIAREGSALGRLSWIAFINENPITVLSCLLVPGTVANRRFMQLLNPGDNDILTAPTDRITLDAGEHTACLTDVIRTVEETIRQIESRLEAWLVETGSASYVAGADMLFTATIRLDAFSEREQPNER
jgi:hypothetical protein